jgi:hypothetical protein
MDTKKIAQGFKLTADRMLDHSVSIHDWKFSFRASMIPMCQWDLLFSYMMADQVAQYPKHFSFMKDYFVSVGTTVHTVVQRWMGRVGMLYGNWQCPKCKAIYEQLGVAYCKECNESEDGIECVYEEYDLSPGTPFCSVHPDGLIKISGIDDYILTDIKTTSLAGLSKIMREGLTKDYQLNYLMQTAIYKYLLTRPPWNFDIAATVLLFVPRDNPSRWRALAFKQKNVEAIYNTVVAEFKEATAVLDSGEFEKIDGVCRCVADANFRDCPWVDFCFSKKRDALAQEMFEEWKGTKSKSTLD